MTPHPPPPPLPPESQRLLRSARKYLLKALPLLQVSELRDSVADIVVTGSWEAYVNVYEIVADARSPIDASAEHICYWARELSRRNSHTTPTKHITTELRALKRAIKSHEQNSQPTLHPAEGV